jgi:F1F0 ATPase subunit 2
MISPSIAGGTPVSLGSALLFASAGLLLGLAHFGALRWNSRLFLSNAPAWQPVLLQLLRLGLTVAALLLIARHGLLPLALSFCGLLLARQLLIARARAAR